MSRTFLSICKEVTFELREAAVKAIISKVVILPDRQVPGDREGAAPVWISPYIGPTLTDGEAPHIQDLVTVFHDTYKAWVKRFEQSDMYSLPYRNADHETKRLLTDFVQEEVENLCLWSTAFGFGNRAANPWTHRMDGHALTDFILVPDDTAFNGKMHAHLAKVSTDIASHFVIEHHDTERYTIEKIVGKMAHAVFASLPFALFASAVRRLKHELAPALLNPPSDVTVISQRLKDMDHDSPLAPPEKAFIIPGETNNMCWHMSHSSSGRFNYGFSGAGNVPTAEQLAKHVFDVYPCYQTGPRLGETVSLASSRISKWVVEDTFNLVWAWFGAGPKMLAHPIVRDSSLIAKPVEKKFTITVLIEVPNATRTKSLSSGASPPTVSFQLETFSVAGTILDAVALTIRDGRFSNPDYNYAAIDGDALRARWMKRIEKHKAGKNKIELRTDGYNFSESRKENMDVAFQQFIPSYSYSARVRLGPATGNRRVFEPGHCGLNNIGNTCYMNSALQCLSNTTLLREFILAEGKKLIAAAAAAAAAAASTDDATATTTTTTDSAVSTTTKPTVPTTPDVTIALCHLLEQLWSGANRSTNPSELKSLFAKRVRRFAGYDQQDSIEFFNAFLDVVHEELNLTKKKKYRERNDEEDAKHDDLTLSRMYWENYRENNRSEIFNIFYGQNRSTLQCLTCGKVSISFDAFACVPVAINVKNMWSYDVTVYFVEKRYARKLRVRVAAGSSMLNIQQETYQALDAARSTESGADIPECRSPYGMIVISYGSLRKMTDIVEAPQKPDRYYASSYDSTKLTIIVSPTIQQEVESDLAAAEMVKKEAVERQREKKAETPKPSGEAAAAAATAISGPTENPETTPSAATGASPNTATAATAAATEGGEAPESAGGAGASTTTTTTAAAAAVATSASTELMILPLGSDGYTTNNLNNTNNSYNDSSSKTSVIAASKEYLRFDIYVGTKLDLYSRHDKPLLIPFALRRKETFGTLRKRVNEILAPHLRPLGEKTLADCECGLEYYNRGYVTKMLLADDEATIESIPQVGEHGYQLISFVARVGEIEILPIATPNLDITLETVPENTFETPKMSLETCLESAYKSTDLTGMEQWYCPRCKQHQDARKVEQIYVLPKIMVVQLKRFQIAPDGYSMRKVDANVPYPETLDVTTCVGEHLKRDHTVSPLYDLYGVVHHSGSLNWGHYTATAKVDKIPEEPKPDAEQASSDSEAEAAAAAAAASPASGDATSDAAAAATPVPAPPKDVWVDFNDSSATRVSYTCHPDTAYILFYKMRTPTAPTTPHAAAAASA